MNEILPIKSVLIDKLLCARHCSDHGDTTMKKTWCICTKSLKVTRNTDTYIGIVIQWENRKELLRSTKEEDQEKLPRRSNFLAKT